MPVSGDFISEIDGIKALLNKDSKKKVAQVDYLIDLVPDPSKAVWQTPSSLPLPPGSPVPPEQGLLGEYYSSPDLSPGTLAATRVDKYLNFTGFTTTNVPAGVDPLNFGNLERNSHAIH